MTALLSRRPGATESNWMEGIRAAAAEAGVPAIVRGVGTVFKVVFPDEGAVADARGLTSPPSGRLGAWLEGMLDNGVYLLPDGRWYVSTVTGTRKSKPRWRRPVAP